MTCPSSLQLSRALSQGADGKLKDHLINCPACAAQWKVMSQVHAVVQDLPYVIPDKGRRDEVRKRLLAAAARQPLPTSPAPRWRWVAWTAAAAALLGVLLGARLLPQPTPKGPRASHFRAVVQSQGPSRFVHERTGSDEWVRLSDGTLHVEVQPLSAGERFRVLCADGEVEVRGTAFETVVEHDHLLRVYVLHGRVEVRPNGAPATLLGAGARWQADDQPKRASSQNDDALLASVGAAKAALLPGQVIPISPSNASVPKVRGESIAEAPLPSTRPAATVTVRRAAPLVRSSVSKVGVAAHPIIPQTVATEGLPALLTKPAISPAERSFMDGWTALRKGRHQAAAEFFTRAAEQNKDTNSAALSEDARFWRAVALARAGQRHLAVAALREFLRQHPTAVRFGEARVILGFQLLRDGQLDEAQRCFESAQQDSHSQIRESARAGLAAVAARR